MDDRLIEPIIEFEKNDGVFVFSEAGSDDSPDGGRGGCCWFFRGSPEGKHALQKPKLSSQERQRARPHAVLLGNPRLNSVNVFSQLSHHPPVRSPHLTHSRIRESR